ncbi:glycosyltransferase [Billgrantia azerbaijanica]|nr:glycosyltransferase [Halomonas azerbaijanica]
MKKICVILHSIRQGGGIQERRAMLVKEWACKGHLVTVISPESGDQDIQSFKDFANVGSLGVSLRRQRFQSLYFCIKLWIFFRNSKDFDAVLTSGVLTSFIVTLSASISGFESKIFCTFHNPIKKEGGLISWVEYMFKAALVKYAVNRSYRCGVNSIALAQEVEAITNVKPVTTIYNPVVDRDFMGLPPKKTHREDIVSHKKILAVGRLCKQKGFDLLLRAIALIKKDVVLEIAGEGPQESELKKLSEILGVGRRVNFIGYHKDIVGLMRSADCFVLSSRWEGFGNVLVEALYAQIPIVSYDCDYGPREVLENGKYGILVKEKTPEALALAIEKALQSSMPVNKRWEDFTVQKIALEYLEFMDIAET